MLRRVTNYTRWFRSHGLIGFLTVCGGFGFLLGACLMRFWGAFLNIPTNLPQTVSIPWSFDRYGDRLPNMAIVRLGTVRLRQEGTAIRSVAFTPNGEKLASVGSNGIMQICFCDFGLAFHVIRKSNFECQRIFQQTIGNLECEISVGIGGCSDLCAF